MMLGQRHRHPPTLKVAHSIPARQTMGMGVPDNTELQYVYFNKMRDHIHAELIEAGFADLLAERGECLEQQPECVISTGLQALLEMHPDNPSVLERRAREKAQWERRNAGLTHATRLVVARQYIYSTSKADIDPDLDPSAAIIGAINEVGVCRETYRNGRASPVSYALTAYTISESLISEPQEPIETGQSLNLSQIAVVETAIQRLMNARRNGELPNLTNSLSRIRSSGD